MNSNLASTSNSRPELPRFIINPHNNDTRSVDELARDRELAGEDNDVGDNEEADSQQSSGDYSEDEEGDNEEVQDESEEAFCGIVNVVSGIKVAADVVLSGSISNVFVSEMIAVGDFIAQPFFEVVLNENEANESPESGDNQNTFQEVLIEASSNKTDRNKICESVVNDEVKVQKSLIKTSKEAGRNEPFEYHQISLENCFAFVELIAMAVSEMYLNENGGSESNESVSQMFVIKTISYTAETNESSESVITDEVVHEETLVETALNDQNDLQESLIEITLSKADITECGEMSLESALESLLLCSHGHHQTEHINESSTVLLTESRCDVKLSEIVAADVVLSGSVSNVFVSEMIAVGDVCSASFENVQMRMREKSTTESGDNQKYFSRAERNEPFESVDRQISLDESIIGPLSLIQSASNKTEGNEGGDVGKSSCHPTTLANLVESDVADGDHISPESALDGVSIKASSTILPAEKKVAADVELFESNKHGTKYSVNLHDSDCLRKLFEENGGSALEGLSLRSLVHPPHEYINESSTVLITESSIKSTSNETEGNEDGDVGKSSYPPTTMANPVVSDVTDGDQISPANALEEKKVAADVELFESVSYASEIRVGNLNAEAVLEMCSNEIDGRESNEVDDQMNSQKFLIKSISNTVEPNEASGSVITDEVAFEETLVETTSKIAEAYDPSKYEEEKNQSLKRPLV
ncbi:hypothetical protein Tco_0662763 [Tanacetum coccineum]